MYGFMSIWIYEYFTHMPRKYDKQIKIIIYFINIIRFYVYLETVSLKFHIKTALNISSILIIILWN